VGTYNTGQSPIQFFFKLKKAQEPTWDPHLDGGIVLASGSWPASTVGSLKEQVGAAAPCGHSSGVKTLSRRVHLDAEWAE
jgi:hypothetical protein